MYRAIVGLGLVLRSVLCGCVETDDGYYGRGYYPYEPYTYSYPYRSYAYSYPNWDYSYPYWGYPYAYYGNYNRFHHYRDRHDDNDEHHGHNEDHHRDERGPIATARGREHGSGFWHRDDGGGRMALGGHGVGRSRDRH
jgi:hypothetical protein